MQNPLPVLYYKNNKSRKKEIIYPRNKEKNLPEREGDEF